MIAVVTLTFVFRLNRLVPRATGYDSVLAAR